MLTRLKNGEYLDLTTVVRIVIWKPYDGRPQWTVQLDCLWGDATRYSAVLLDTEAEALAYAAELGEAANPAKVAAVIKSRRPLPSLLGGIE